MHGLTVSRSHGLTVFCRGDRFGPLLRSQQTGCHAAPGWLGFAGVMGGCTSSFVGSRWLVLIGSVVRVLSGLSEQDSISALDPCKISTTPL